ncbi:MAG TPA: EAL domain-containing protein [Woeseiaceae bacterium]|nr:EAL domain-containing protein [Woeseiaceae bacterium]
MFPANPATNRILVVDDDKEIVSEYLHCLGSNFEPDLATTTLSDLEKVLFGEQTDEKGSARFEVDSRDQGVAGVAAVEHAVQANKPYAIVFLDIRMPPGINGVEAATRIRRVDPNVNIVLVSGSLLPEPEKLGTQIPPADRIFFFKKPFHAIECRQLAAALCGKWHADLALRRANEVLEQRVIDRTADLHRLAYFDPVTKRPNRLKLTDELQVMIGAGTDGRTALVLLDIERFSFLNETMGYEAGTAVLRAIASRLERALECRLGARRSVVGRFGADEFACLMEDVRDETELQELVDYIRQAVMEPFVVNGRDLFLKASMGVAWHPEHGNDPRTIFRCAESALHRSMRRPDGYVTFYHSEMQFRARHQFNMEAELRQAIDNGEITAFFQPQVELKDGRLAGVEALARWIRPNGTIVRPADFIPLSEEMGISDVLFECIMRRVCKTVRSWRDSYGWDVPVSVNLSAHQLRNQQLVQLVGSILEQFSPGKKLINLELTETALLEDLTVARPVLTDLAALGVGIHIDDFGTGYSSLSYLAELPAQTLKIDQTFVQRISESPNNERVVQAIVALGKAMNLEVIAEGVETPQQLELVTRFGCDLAQGFLIAKPMPEKDFLAWWEAHGACGKTSLRVSSAVATR